MAQKESWEHLPFEKVFENTQEQYENNTKYAEAKEQINNIIENLYSQENNKENLTKDEIVNKIMNSEDQIFKKVKELILQIFDDQQQFVTIKNPLLRLPAEETNA